MTVCSLVSPLPAAPGCVCESSRRSVVVLSLLTFCKQSVLFVPPTRHSRGSRLPFGARWLPFGSSSLLALRSASCTLVVRAPRFRRLSPPRIRVSSPCPRSCLPCMLRRRRLVSSVSRPSFSRRASLRRCSPVRAVCPSRSASSPSLGPRRVRACRPLVPRRRRLLRRLPPSRLSRLHALRSSVPSPARPSPCAEVVSLAGGMGCPDGCCGRAHGRHRPGARRDGVLPGVSPPGRTRLCV